MTSDISPDSDAFTAEVCWHYYINELTQAEIAKLLGVTRLRVNQLIQRARALGMVRIEIDTPHLPRFEQQAALQARFGLQQAIVAPARGEDYDCHAPVGAALASYLSNQLRNETWRKIGVSWGLTLQSAMDRMIPQQHPDVEIISMIGGTGRGEAFNTFGVATGFAQRLGASYSLLAAPVFLSPQVDRAAFLAEQSFVEHYEKLSQLDAAILTASNISENSYLIRTGLPAGVSGADLIAAGVVGDVVGRFLNEAGEAIETPLAARTIAIELDMLRQVPVRILAAAGYHKVAIIRAILQAGLANVLITDDVTARLLLG